jgi:cytoskeletal protein RodZ
MRLKFKGGQSMLEYVVLLGLLVAALLIMQFYVKRAYQGRLKQEADKVGDQYAPGYTNSSITTRITSSGTQTTTDGYVYTTSSSKTTVSKDETVDAFGDEH